MDTALRVGRFFTMEDGYRLALVASEGRKTATLVFPGDLATLDVSVHELRLMEPVRNGTIRPRRLIGLLKANLATARRHGRRIRESAVKDALAAIRAEPNAFTVG